MAKRPSLTKTVSEAAFFNAWFAETPKPKLDQEVYQRIFERYLNRFSKMPGLSLKNIVRVADIESNYLCDLLTLVLLKILESTGNDEFEFWNVREGLTITGETGEVTPDGDINLDSGQLRKNDNDVAMASIAHEIAHIYLKHHLKMPTGLKHEHEADELARSWGFNIDKLRKVCGPATIVR